MFVRPCGGRILDACSNSGMGVIANAPRPGLLTSPTSLAFPRIPGRFGEPFLKETDHSQRIEVAGPWADRGGAGTELSPAGLA